MAGEVQNRLLSSQKSSDSSLQVALHPLVLLTISDYITRHTLRNQKGPVVGALLGQQNGREITIEHAFECLLIDVESETILHKSWFEERLQQSKSTLRCCDCKLLICTRPTVKDVHKVPALDLVGWYTILPTSGPQPVHLPIHRQILENYNESAILLGFHPAAVLDGPAGVKLPLTIYESNFESEESTTESGEDKEMKDGEPQLGLKFRELPYSVETGEAEMIGVDFVARGGGNATAVAGVPAGLKTDESVGNPKARGATKPAEQEPEPAKLDDQHVLSREDEELIASLTAKANAIKMLHARINLVATYLKNLPPACPSGSPLDTAESSATGYSPVNYSVLRSIQALLGRLSLVIPADAVAFEQELQSEKNDVNVVSLLSSITNSIRDIKETGRKFSVVEAGRNIKGKGNAGRAGWDVSGRVLGVGDLLA
jgi:COP9 signalosome complex subunit 6